MPEPPDHPEKDLLRRQARARRWALSARQRQQKDTAIRRHLAHHPVLEHASAVAAFLTFDGEPDLRDLLDQWREARRSIALPVIDPGPEPRMDFSPWTTGTTLAPNRFGIPEPAHAGVVDLTRLDVVLCPLVAFDDQGGRLGMGAGYYDRALAPVSGSRRPLRVGVAYAAQRTDRLPVTPHDIPLHAVVTEKGWFTCPD